MIPSEGALRCYQALIFATRIGKVAPTLMLVAAEAVVRGALVREESCGAHHREDFPEESDAWRKNILWAGDEGSDMHLWTEPVPELPEVIQKALDEDYSLDYHYLE